MQLNERGVDDTPKCAEEAFEAARSLARAIGETEVFRRFEAARDAFQADEATRAKLLEHQRRQEDLRAAAMWGGASIDEQRELEHDREELAHLPTLRDYLQAQEALRELFRDVAGQITREIGVDYGAACSPGGGCC